MPDPDDQTSADEETIPQSSLHAYREGREEDVEGDLEKLKHGGPKDLQQSEVEEADADRSQAVRRES